MTITQIHVGSRRPITADTVCESCGFPVALVDPHDALLSYRRRDMPGKRCWCEVHTSSLQWNGFYDVVFRVHTPDLCQAVRAGHAEPVRWIE